MGATVAANRVALLRGINVGGHRRVPMAPLRVLCERLGLRDVATYIQSGNIVFSSDQTPPTLTETIHDGIVAEFDVDCDVIVRDAADLVAAVDRHPFATPDADESKLGLVFLDATPTAKQVAALVVPDGEPERIVAIDDIVYIDYPDGMGRSVINDAFLARAMPGRVRTVRNLRTVRRLAEMTA